MNFVGHIEVARRLPGAPRAPGEPSAGFAGPGGERAGYLVGAALPDFAAMGRFRLSSAAAADGPVGERSRVGLRRGLEVHHRTDDAFHRHRWFREASVAVTERLQADGVARGPAMACGHVGVELLLDGIRHDFRGRRNQHHAASERKRTRRL